MLAVLSTDKLTTISLKRRANSINSTLSLPFKPSSLTSSPSTFFIASSDTIYACNPSSLALTPIHTAASRISHLLATTDALVYTTNTTIHILSPARARAAQIIVSHDTPVTAIALSNNVSLIASVTSSEVHIHNIALKKTAPIVLRLPPSVPVTTALFHPHACTRLVLGAGTLLFVFDTAKPDDPPRCITVETGDIKAMSCSPFSKSLIALATSGGSVGLVDLDKEKPVFRNIALRVSLTSLAFSPEGAALYVGTEQGKLLVLDLRALEKEPVVLASQDGEQIIGINIMQTTRTPEPSTKPTSTTSTKPPEPANPVRRATSAASSKPAPPKQNIVTKTTTTAPSKTARPLTTRPTVKPAATMAAATVPPSSGDGADTKPLGTTPQTPPSPQTPSRIKSKANPYHNAKLKPTARGISSARAGVGTGTGSRTAGVGPGGSAGEAPERRGYRVAEMMATRAIETAVDVPKSPREKVLSPVRDPLGNAGTSSASGAHGSDRVSENAYAVAKTKEENKKVAEPERKVDLHSLDTDCDSNSDIRPTNVNLGIGIEAEAESISTAVRGGRKAKMQAEAAYDARDQSLRGGGRRARSRAESYSSTRSGAKSSASVCSGLRIIRGESESARELVRVRERERAPAVSDTRATEGGGQQVFGERISRTPSPDLPAIDRDVDTPVPKEKKVAAAGTRMGIGVLGLGTPEVERWLEAGMGRDVGEGTEREGRKVGFKDTSDGEGQGENEASDNEEERERERSMSLQISPRRSGPASSDPTPAPASAHDLLRTIVRDVMYDMQSETRAGLTGLHLDLLRMGRGWRKEVRGVMEECGYGAGGELERLREENRRLREENERLKRRLA